jgi:hypothetical protein
MGVMTVRVYECDGCQKTERGHEEHGGPPDGWSETNPLHARGLPDPRGSDADRSNAASVFPSAAA